ncbi:50S ribosomal protein L25 [Geotalea uraniireducens]|uniref:Large ribosomal subunit protein bL25 n=1 Tax=Geotalea uraniireducens TaxID=351604 RepID=A0ABM8EH86_9BACT|nr:50S ribosomal protein L25 [Geotalea uraniireducens]BDV41791.1 50S ribosomal protein L25 [Geotalea uraniireducens]
MEQKAISIDLRTGLGKSAVRKLRVQGLAPGVVYGKGLEPVPVTVNAKELLTVIAGEGGQNNLIRLQGGGSLDGSTVIVADLQRTAIKGELVHVDLHKIDLAELVHVKVSVSVVGSAAGVKEGGLLDVVTHSLDIECLPGAIPEHVEVDVTNLAIGQSFHVSDLVLPEGVKALDDAKMTIASVHGRAKEQEEAAAPEE